MTPADRLLERLEGVREVGHGRWVARCSAHEDRRPSLSIRECSDGRLLVHCFASCDVGAVVAAVGLDLKDLFPPDEAWRPATSTAPKRTARGRVPKIPGGDALAVLDLESFVVENIAHKVASGEKLTEGLVADLENSARRIGQIRTDWGLL